MPSLIANIASDSGKQGESYILQIQLSPRPFRSDNRVVDACAMIFPPISIIGFAWNIALPFKLTTIWFVMITATLWETGSCEEVLLWKACYAIEILFSSLPDKLQLECDKAVFFQYEIHQTLRWRIRFRCLHPTIYQIDAFQMQFVGALESHVIHLEPSA